MRLVLIHGWGFHGGVWDALIARLPDAEPVSVDLGFIREGPKGVSEIPPGEICVGHSFGVLWLLKHGPRPIRALVSIAGFDRFRDHGDMKGLEAMKEGLRRNPEAQMRAFWKSCGLKGDELQGRLDPATLRGGLGWLGTWDAQAERKALDAPILALASEDDQIVPAAASRAIWGNGGDAELHMRKTGGHALPMTQAQWCADRIREFADDLGP